MVRYLLVLAAGALLGFWPASTSAQQPEPGSQPAAQSGTVTSVRVIDGDTLEGSRDGRRFGIAIAGIRAAPGNSVCGQAAVAALWGLVREGIRYSDEGERTFNGRTETTFRVETAEGRLLARELAAAGLARATGDGSDRDQIAAAEAAARAARRGCLWERDGGDEPAPLPPLTAPESRAAERPDAPSSTFTMAGFSETVIARGFSWPTAMANLPDGRLLIGEKRGVVWSVRDGVTSSTPVIDIRSRVNDYWDRGLMGVAVDPAFASNGFIYLAYVYENNRADYAGPKTARVARYTVTSGGTASMSSEFVVLGTTVGRSCNDYPAGTDCIPADIASHTLNHVAFAPDGTLYVSMGDAGDFGRINDNSLRAQNRDLLAGKLLRVTATGAGVPGNPFWTGNAAQNRSKVWGYGFRNPFRFSFRPGSNVPYVGDVGWYTAEEINVATAGGNFGWPCYEGPNPHDGYRWQPLCQTLIAQGPSAVRPPLYSWPHPGTSTSVTGGLFYTGTSYPSQLQGAYIFGDYGLDNLRYFKVDAQDRLVPGSEGTLGTGIGGVVAFTRAANGDICYIAIGPGEARCLRYNSSSNQPPVARAGATPTSGSAPLTVQFSSSGSSDPENQSLSYSWNFGDGTPASTEANPRHTYQSNGSYTATLTVRDAGGATGTAQVAITAGNRAPTATISAPVATLRYAVGDTISFSGSGADPDQGTLPASALSWQVIIHHCPYGDCHEHILIEATGTSGSFVAPDHGDDSHFEIRLTATDSGGLRASNSVLVYPRVVDVTLASSPSGFTIVWDGATYQTPVTRPTVVNSRHSLSTPAQQHGATFVSWAHGGARDQTVTVGTAPVTYTATFSGGAPPPSGRVIYDDAPASGWLDHSWGTTVNLAATSPVNSGSRAISFQITQPWAGFKLVSTTGIAAGSNTHLQFAIRANQSGQRYLVVLSNPANATIGQRALAAYDCDPVASAWKTCRVPLADLGAAGQTIGGVLIQDATGTAQPVAYLDDISLTSGPASAGTVVYGDALAAGWLNWSWNTTVNLAVASPTNSGNAAVSFQTTRAWAGLKFHNPAGVASGAPTHVQFAIRGSAAGQRYLIELTTPANTLLGRRALATYNCDPVAGAWKTCRVPLADLGAAGRPIGGILIQDVTGAPQPVAYLDDLALVADGGTSSPPPAPSVAIFDDALAGGWVNWSFGTATRFDVTTPVHRGARAISFQITQPWTGMKVASSTGVAAGSYTHLMFAIRGTTAGQRYLVVLSNPANATLGQRALAGYGCDPSVDAWKVCRIPLSDLGAGGRTIGGVLIQDAAGTGQPLAYLDDLGLVTLAGAAAQEGSHGGDANGDGQLSVTDALCILRAVAEYGATEGCPARLTISDPSGDGVENAADALCVLRATSGLPATDACPGFAAGAVTSDAVVPSPTPAPAAAPRGGRRRPRPAA